MVKPSPLSIKTAFARERKWGQMLLNVPKTTCLPSKTKNRKPQKATKCTTERNYTDQGALAAPHENFHKTVRNEAVKR